MSSLVQISDTHFGTEQPHVVEALLKWVERTQPDVVLLSGDITQRARSKQFAAAAQFAAQLGTKRVLAIPGNHDIPLFDPLARLFWPYAHFQRAFGADLEPSYESEDLLVLALNTTRAFRHKHGQVSRQQVEAVAQRLSRARPGQLRIVATHQPVLAIRAKDTNNLLRGSEVAVPRWCQAGADLLLGGHIHLPYVRPLRDRFPQLERNAWVVQAGTAVSQRVRGGIPNSVNHIRVLAPLQCRVERWDFAVTSGAFELVHAQELTLERPALS